MAFIEEFQFIFCLIILILGFFGNLLVIIIFSRKGAKLKAHEVLVISLAIGDLLGTFCLPVLTILQLKADMSVLGDFGCQFIYWLSTTSLTGSAFSLVAISIDRLGLVIWPHQRRPRPWKISLIALLIWTMASSPGIIYFLRVYYSPQPYNRCSVDFKDNREDIAHTISLFLIQMIAPMAVMSVVYGIILYRLKMMVVRRLSTVSNSFAVRQKKNRKLTGLFLAVVTMFFVLTLPYNIFYLWYTMNWQTIQKDYKYHQKIGHVYHILLLIMLLNSCVNPLIYAKLHKSFRRITLRILCPCLKNQFLKPCNQFSRSTWCKSRSVCKSITSITSDTISGCHSRGSFLASANQDPFFTRDAQNKGDNEDVIHPLRMDSPSFEDDRCSPETAKVCESYL